MRRLTIAIAIVAVTASITAAQDPREMPKTVPFNDKNGTQIGTATFSSGGIYIRDLKGELIATIARDKEGRFTLYDQHGKVLDQINPK